MRRRIVILSIKTILADYFKLHRSEKYILHGATQARQREREGKRIKVGLSCNIRWQVEADNSGAGQPRRGIERNGGQKKSHGRTAAPPPRLPRPEFRTEELFEFERGCS